MLIDMQVNMFDPTFPVSSADSLLERLTGLLARSRHAGVPVVFVRNCGGPGDPDERGTPGWSLHPALQPERDDVVLDKTTGDAFMSTPLDDRLKSLGVTRLVVAGLQSEYCVKDTTLGALARGYEVVLVSDGHSTYDGGGVTAAEKSAAVTAELDGKVSVASADDVLLR